MDWTSVRARAVRARVADWWAGAWRWVLLAAGAALAVYFCSDRGIAERGLRRPAAIALLVIGVVLTGQHADGDRAHGDARALRRRSGPDSAGGDLSVSDVALAAAFGTAVLLATPLQPPDAPAAVAEPLLPVRDAVHGHREPATPRTRSSGSTRGCWSPARWSSAGLSAGPGYARAALTLMIGRACVIAVGTIVTGRPPVRCTGTSQRRVSRRGRCRCTRTSPGTAMAFAAIIAYVQPVVGRSVEAVDAAGVLAAGRRDRDDPVAAGDHRADRRDPRRRRRGGGDGTLAACSAR